MPLKNAVVRGSQFVAGVIVPGGLIRAQEISKLERGEAEDMLQVVGNDVKKHYYNPKFEWPVL